MPISLRGHALLLPILAAGLHASIAAATATQDATAALSPAQAAEVDARIAAWVGTHPELLRRVLDPVRDAVPVDAEDGVLGRDGAAVTVVAFIDRGTPVGAQTVQQLAALVATDPGVRVVIKEMPLLPQSVAPAQAVTAARQQGREAAARFEAALIARPAATDSKDIEDAAAAAGLDLARLAADRSAAATMPYLRRIRRQAASLGVTAAPTLLIGNHSLVGMQDMERLRAAVAAARQAGG